jgi:HTH-type transcriptional regulator/antitoxin HigA
MMIEVPEKYALEVSSPAPITSRDEEKYAGVLMTLIEAYEEAHHSIPDAPPVEILRTLMDANDLRQKDLVPIFGSESIVSEVLHKKRELNKIHIEKLSKRFHVSPAVFFLAHRG